MRDNDQTVSDPDAQKSPDLPAVDETFQEWLSHTASNKGVPERELLGQLMSSYWILEDLMREMDGTMFALAEDRSDDDSEPEIDDDRLFEFLETVSDGSNAHDQVEGTDGRRTSVIDLIDSLASFGRERDEQANEPDTRGLNQALPIVDRYYRRLEDGLDELEAEMEAVGTQAETDLNELRDRLDGIESRTEDSVTATEIGSIESRLAALESAYDAIDATQGDLSEQFERALSTHENRFDTVTEQLDSIGSAVETYGELLGALRGEVSTNSEDLDDAGTVLRHLLDRVEQLEVRADGLVRVLEELGPVVSGHHNRSRLDEIRSRAARLDVKTAWCEACDEATDVRLLARPECPHCRAPIRNVEQRRGLLRPKTILATASEGLDVDQSDWMAKLWPEPETPHAVDSGFVWVGDRSI